MANSRKTPTDFSRSVHWIRSKIARVGGRKIRVVIYARYSTDEQNPQSIEAQVAYCRRFLTALGLSDDELQITVLSDPGISGEIIHRPGILQVLEGIQKRRFDLVVPEDASRLYRNVSATMEFAETAVDHDVRLICINDEVDTADEEYWEDRLYEAARHHAKSNKLTSRRIQRALEDLWEQGAAIGLLKPGYRRMATHPAANGEAEFGPFFDEVDPAQASIILETYRRVAGGEQPWVVAGWLTSIGFPKAANSRSAVWTADNVIALIKRLDYRGVQIWRATARKKKKRTGKRYNRKNESERILTRDMPKLRIVEDWVWYKANEAICARNRNGHVRSGDEHCLAGIPRDSRSPLSNLFFCHCCKQKMHGDGRREGGYRCSICRDGLCWNKASALADLTHHAICGAITKQLRSLGERVGRLAEQAGPLLSDGGRRDVRRIELQREAHEHKTAIDNLNAALETAKVSPQSTILRIGKHEEELATKLAELDGLSFESSECAPVTSKEILGTAESLVAALKKPNRETRDLLKDLVGTIWAVPHQQFAGDKVVLRAKFELRLHALLPTRTRAALAAICGDVSQCEFERIPLVVNLFKPSTGPEHGLAAFQLAAQENAGLTAIGKRLGITKRQAHIAVQYGRAMRDAGIDDPFIELTEAPSAGSRWRNRPRPSSGSGRAIG